MFSDPLCCRLVVHKLSVSHCNFFLSTERYYTMVIAAFNKKMFLIRFYMEIEKTIQQNEYVCSSTCPTFTSMILFLMSDCRKTQTNLTSRFCMYFSFICSQVVIQLEIYRCMNSEGRSTTW